MEQIKIFCSYAHKDLAFVHQLKAHFAHLERLYSWTVWNYMEMSAGVEREQTIQEHLNTAQIILLLISPDFMDSDYCYSQEMKRAMERHEKKEARVIPVILRPVARWEDAPFGKLYVLPEGGKPITDHSWQTADYAFAHVVEKIAQAIETLIGKSGSDALSPVLTQGVPEQIELPGPQALDLSRISETLGEGMLDINPMKTYMKVYEQQMYAYQFLIRMIEHYGAREAVLLQYSCHTSLDVLRVLLRKGAKVTVFIQHEDVSVTLGSQFQAQRIKDTTMNLRSELGDELLKTRKLKVYKYHVPSSISAIKIDKSILCMGWYTYEETKQPAHKSYPNDSMELSAHDRTAVVVWQGRDNLQLLDEADSIAEGAQRFQAFDKTFSVLEKNYRKYGEIVPI